MAGSISKFNTKQKSRSYSEKRFRKKGVSLIGRPPKYRCGKETIMTTTSKEFKERLNKLSERNGEPICDIIERAVNFLYPITNDLTLQEAELEQQLQEIRAKRKQASLIEEGKRMEALKISETEKEKVEIAAKYSAYRTINANLMDSCYAEIKDKTKDYIERQKKTIELFEQKEKILNGK
jgi:hypothetical protein